MKRCFPEWIRRPWPGQGHFETTKGLIHGLDLNTVCQSARCPNIGECWARGTATVMVLGNTCTRNCRYCSVASGHPGPPDPGEPSRVGEAVRQMGLRYAVVTSVTRDDLADGGASHIAKTVRAIRGINPTTVIDVLAPDFQGDRSAIETVLRAEPGVFGHNIETVPRLYAPLRGRRSSYTLALDVLKAAQAFEPRPIIKSALMVGHGETPEEVRRTLADLVETGCDAVSIGQYLQPTLRQRPVAEYVRPEQFTAYQELAYGLGFRFVVAGPFVRSSYRAEEVLRIGLEQMEPATARRNG